MWYFSVQESSFQVICWPLYLSILNKWIWDHPPLNLSSWQLLTPKFQRGTSLLPCDIYSVTFGDSVWWLHSCVYKSLVSIHIIVNTINDASWTLYWQSQQKHKGTKGTKMEILYLEAMAPGHSRYAVVGLVGYAPMGSLHWYCTVLESSRDLHSAGPIKPAPFTSTKFT